MVGFGLWAAAQVRNGAPTAPARVQEAHARVLRVSVPHPEAGLRSTVGSAVVVGPGLVATNAHVVMDGTVIRVEQDGQSWEAHLRNLDPLRDLALLEVPRLPLPPAPLAEAAPVEGEVVYSWSYPGGHGPALTSGAFGSTWAYRGHWMLQAELEVARGSSGGGLFDGEGQLLGLTTFVLDSSPHSVFAVPARWIREMMTEPPSPMRPGGSRTLLLQGFLAQMSQAPENQQRWLKFTEAWARKAPQDPEAWSAHAQALQASLGMARTWEATPGSAIPSEGAVRESLERALALDRTRAVDWHNLGVSLDAENKFAEAAQAFRESLRLRPEHGPSWSGLGCTLFNARDYRGAQEALQRATELTPDDASSWALMAFSERDLKQWVPATAHFKVALGLSPFRAGWWQAYGECAARCQDKEAFTRALERLRLLDPSAAKGLERMGGRLQ